MKAYKKLLLYLFCTFFLFILSCCSSAGSPVPIESTEGLIYDEQIHDLVFCEDVETYDSVSNEDNETAHSEEIAGIGGPVILRWPTLSRQF